jgi:hypothetical protein
MPTATVTSQTTDMNNALAEYFGSGTSLSDHPFYEIEDVVRDVLADRRGPGADVDRLEADATKIALQLDGMVVK